MKNSITQTLVDAFLNETARPLLFLKIRFDVEVRMVKADIDLYLLDERYRAYTFSIGLINSQAGLAVDRAEISVADLDQNISAHLLRTNQRGSHVSLYVAAIDNNGVMIGHAEFFRGMLSTYEIFDDTVTLSVVNEMILWKKKTLRKAQSSCPWPFKGEECAYTGTANWCDQTYDRCYELGNTSNFCGQRFLPHLMETKIWWGKMGE